MLRFFLLATAVAGSLSLSGADSAQAASFSQKDLVALDRVGDAHASPDGRLAVYNVAALDAGGDKRVATVWVVATDGKGAPRQVAEGYNPRWSSDSASIYYLVKGQVWTVCASCQTPVAKQVTNLAFPVGSFRIAPDAQRLIFSTAVYPDVEDPIASKTRDEERSKSGATGRFYEKLFVRHWDSWDDGKKNHLFSLSLVDGVAAGAPVALMRGFDGDSPGKPFGGDEDYTITPDSKSVVFSARLAGRTEPWSLNFDLYSAPIDGSSPPVNLTADNKAADANASFSPDGSQAAYRAMKREGYVSDRIGAMVYDVSTGARRAVAPDWDRSINALAFSGDGRSLYALAGETQQVKLFSMDIKSGAVKALTGDGEVASMDVASGPDGDVVVYVRSALDQPPELYALRPGGKPMQLTHVTERQRADVELAKAESFTFKGWNDDVVHGWIVKPAGWKPGVKYPTVLLIHGGPQGTWANGWNTRWNPQVWASWGYGVVMIDPHGSTGYGEAFTDAVSNHWGDRPLEDLQKGWADVQRQAPWIDADKACAAGASYGGYMTYWMAGVWNKPWKCLISHDGVFDNRNLGYATEELWASVWESGGVTPWGAPENYEKFNPINQVAHWSKPMLVIHSDKDFRIPVDQGISAFTALQWKGIPSQFLNFPDENHWVSKPKNSLQWHDTVESWLAKWIGPDAK